MQTQPSSNTEIIPQERFHNRVWIAAVLIVALFIGGTAIWDYFRGRWYYTTDIPGDPRTFDPIGTYPYIARFAGNNVLLQDMDMHNVKQDGTMDLTADDKPYVTYEFYEPVPLPKNPPPIGADGGTANHVWSRDVDVEVHNPGYTAIADGLESLFGISLPQSTLFGSKGVSKDFEIDETHSYNDTTNTLRAPQCSLAEFWKTALKEGAPADSVARIDYGIDGYDFVIENTNIHFEFTPDCKLTNNDYGHEPIEHE